MTQPSPHADAIARHERYLQADSANTTLLRALGDLYHQDGQFDKAIERYQRCIAIKPDEPVSRSRIAGVYISQHRFAEAEAELREVLAGGTADPVLLHNLGVSLYHQQRWPEAQAHCRRRATPACAMPTTCAISRTRPITLATRSGRSRSAMNG